MKHGSQSISHPGKYIEALPLGKWIFGSTHLCSSWPAQVLKWFSKPIHLVGVNWILIYWNFRGFNLGRYFLKTNFLKLVITNYSKVLSYLFTDTLISLIHIMLSNYWYYNKVMSYSILFIYAIFIYYALFIFITLVLESSRCLIYCLWIIKKFCSVFFSS